MKKKPYFLATLAVGLALGTAWAVCGKFGHEQGAAWAGAIGALAIEKPALYSNLIPILFVTLFVPFVVWEQSLSPTGMCCPKIGKDSISNKSRVD